MLLPDATRTLKSQHILSDQYLKKKKKTKENILISHGSNEIDREIVNVLVSLKLIAFPIGGEFQTEWRVDVTTVDRSHRYLNGSNWGQIASFENGGHWISLQNRASDNRNTAREGNQRGAAAMQWRMILFGKSGHEQQH